MGKKFGFLAGLLTYFISFKNEAGSNSRRHLSRHEFELKPKHNDDTNNDFSANIKPQTLFVLGFINAGTIKAYFILI